MLENNKEEVMSILSDRVINPNPQDVSHLFAQRKSDNLGPENRNEMFKKLDALIQDYNLQLSKVGRKTVLQKYSTDTSDSEVQTDDDQEPPCKKRKKKSSPLSVVICTPLMARVHQDIHQAGEIAYIDSMFVISTGHSGGGLPIGVLITSDEKASTLERSFAYFCKIFPDFALLTRDPQMIQKY